MKASIFVLFAMLGGCVTKPITLPDGTQGYVVECRSNLAICYKRASKLCPEGYDVVDDDRIEFAKASGYGAHVDTNITKVIRCKDTWSH